MRTDLDYAAMAAEARRIATKHRGDVKWLWGYLADLFAEIASLRAKLNPPLYESVRQ